MRCRWFTGAILVVAAPLALPAPLSGSSLPPMMLWVWERPVDLRDLDVAHVGVAFLAATVHVDAGEVIVVHRHQPLLVPPGTARVAVARIETGRGPLPGPEQAERVAAVLAELGDLSDVRGVQIDFDARVSERAFMRDVLDRLRRRRPLAWVSMTALVSWCLGDPWIADLPVDEIVPMVFRMGPEGDVVRRQLAAGGDFQLARCRDAIGVSTDEPLPRMPGRRRRYVFDGDQGKTGRRWQP